MSENLSVLSSSRVPEILKGEYNLQNWKKIQVTEFWFHKIVKISFYPCRLVHVKILARNYLGNMSYVDLKFFVPLVVMQTKHSKMYQIFTCVKLQADGTFL